MIAAVVLAAGEGRRFGAVKQLAPLRGRPLVEHVLAAVRAVGELRKRIVVLGHAAGEVRAGADLGGFEVVVCPDWADGQAASLRAGVAAAGDADAVLVALADQPGLTARAIRNVLASRDPERFDAVRATYAGAPGHPVLLERPVLARIGELRGDRGARAILGDVRVRPCECGHLADATDVDTPDALEVLQP